MSQDVCAGMVVGGLFAGIGGFEYGMSRAGHRPGFFCDILETSRAVLAHHYPGVALHDDVTTLVSLPDEIQILTAGFPCQDLSQSGTKTGLAGKKSGLISEVFRLIEERKSRGNPVPWVVVENVSFMLSLNQGSAIRTIVSEFERLGYRWAYRLMDTQGFGLPQRRQRVYLVASIEGSPQDVLLSEDVATERPVTRIGQQAHGFYWTEGLLGLGWAPDAIPTLRNGSSVGIPSPPAVLMPDGRVVKPRIRAAERLQGFPCDWTLPAERVARPAARWTLVGNAVSTPIPEWIGRRLMNPGRYDPCRNAEFPAKGRAPNAAWSDGRTRYGCDIGTDPLGLEAPDLAQFLGDDVELLSVRATAGFLERTARSKLKFHAGFLEAVRLHLEKMRIEQATKMEDGAPSAQKVLDAPLNTQRLSNPSMQQAKTPHTDQR